MNRDRWERLQEIFASAVELPSAERSAYVESHCGDDAELRQELMRLLAHPPSSPAMLDRPMVAPGLLERMTGDGRLAVNEVLAGRFTIVRHLGAGGMGDVYEAIDNTLGGRIAIKTIRTEIANNPQVIARFQREISLARQVTHPNICRVFDLVSGTRSSTGARVDFLTMEYLEGETLSAFLKREAPLALTEALPIIEQVAIGLDAAHDARIMHRDLKASNIMLTTNATGATRAVITDFGLARSMEGGDTIATGSGWGAGTPAYMAPEQIEGRQLSHSADIYALGVVMYEMATGVQPYTGESPLQVAVKRLKEQPARPRESNAEIEPAWEAAILKCLAYEPANRFPTAGKMAEALRGGRVVRLPRAMPKNVTLWLGGLLAVALAGLGLWHFGDSLFAPSVPPDVERLYALGVNAIHDGAYHKATQLLERATQRAPDFAAAHTRLAEAWQELDYRDKAREELVKSMDVRPRSRDEARLREAAKAALTGQWDNALAALRSRVDGAANPTDALMDVAMLQDRAGRSDQAIADYRMVMARDPNRPGAMVRLAELLAARSLNTEAGTLLTSADAAYRAFANPEGQGRVLLARANMERNIPAVTDLAKQAEQMAKLGGSQSLLVRSQLRQAQALDAAGDAEAAKVLLTDAIRLAEEAGLGSLASMALFDLGYQLFTLRNTGAAERYLVQAMQVAQRYGSKYAEANARLGLAEVFLYGKRLDEVEPLLVAAEEFFAQGSYRAKQVQVRLLLGDKLRVQARFNETAQKYDEAMKMAETDYDRARIQERLARLALLRLRYEEAAIGFEKAVEFRKRTGELLREQFARLDLSLALRSSGRFTEAQTQLDIIAAQKPADKSVRISLAHYYAGLDFQRGRFAEAIDALLQLLQAAEQDKQDSQVRDLKSEICVKAAEAGQADRALRYCTEMLPLRKGVPSFQIDLYGGLALANLTMKRIPEAIVNARKAVAIATQIPQERDIFYQGMVLTEILRAAGKSEWREQREATRRARQVVENVIGKDAMKLYMARPLVAAHWKAVEEIQ